MQLIISSLGAAMVVAALALPTPTSAQQQGDTEHEWCDESWGNRDADRHCEVREFTRQADGRLISVDGGGNGGIRVEGWGRNEVQIVARIQTWDRRGDAAAELARDIEIETGRIIEATGPGRRGNDEGWAVSYRIMVPMNSDLSLETVNGGIAVADVQGDIDFRATNGGVDLTDVGGDVRGRTTNGGLRVSLSGDEWSGRGLDVETTNGGITVMIPDGYRARLETGTVNGGFRIDFPIMVEGRISRRIITTDLNGGGPPIRVVTTNGGVVVTHR